MANHFQVSENTEQYFQAQRSLTLSNGDTEFIDTANHSDELVRDVIDSYYEVIVMPMLSRVEKSVK